MTRFPLPKREEKLPPPSAALFVVGITQAACLDTMADLESGKIKPRQFRQTYAEKIDRRWTMTEKKLFETRLRDPSLDDDLQREFEMARRWWRHFEAALIVSDEEDTA